MMIAINLTLIESLALLFVILLFGITIYLFIRSRRTLKQTLEDNKLIFPQKTKPEKITPVRKPTLAELEQQFEKRYKQSSFFKKEEEDEEFPQPLPLKKPVMTALPADDKMSHDLKSTIAQQQKLLNTYLRQIEELENEGKEELRKENNDLQKEIVKLHNIIEKKDEEVEELRQEASAGLKMAARIEEVYREFDLLQNKMVALEKQANRANNLAIELEDTRHSYEAVHKELMRKQEKLEEVLSDNQRMREERDMLEDKLSEANLQRQQLHKKVQFLTDLNTDMQSLSDTNKKLQTELRRIGELESMLNMMAEERDFLLRNKKK